MEVDDDEGTQRPRRVNDYGIELDFDILDDEEREVHPFLRRCMVAHFSEGWLLRDGRSNGFFNSKIKCRNRAYGAQHEGNG